MSVWVEAGREGRLLSYDASGIPDLQPGDLVQVRLRGRLHTGLVSAESSAAPPGMSLEPVLQRLETAAVDQHWQALLQQVALHCHTAPFQVLKAALPGGWLGQKRSGGSHGRRQLVASLQTNASLGGEERPLTARQLQVLEHLQRHGPLPLSQLESSGHSRAVVKAVEQRGLLKLETKLLQGDATAPAAVQRHESPPALSSQQQQALQQLADAPQQPAWLLWGVTGSGKTEVYLRCCEEPLQRGQSVLMLTPEIGLIPQLQERCRRRFGEVVVSFHSGMSEGERIRAWRRCRSGAPCLVVGTRSAIFLPLAQLGLIVLDEEHDSSYKQEAPMPCYHARDVALMRQRLQGCRLILGSATPSLESWLLTQGAQPSLGLLRLSERIAARPLPPVRLVDMRQELAEGHRRLLSRPLLDRLQRLPERGEQAVVLVPRRGYSTFLSCRSCGEAVQCPHCDVSLTVHRSREGRSWLRCHWCDHREEMEQRCRHCGSTAFKPFGAGTQRVIDTLEEELEGLRLLRFDRDSTRGRDGHQRLLDRFAAGDADVLVGTQMLAKGMDLPQVTLAAVLAADGLLHRPDVRAAEQSLQLLLQLAGRAGRGEQPGEVLVQTYSPDHRVIRHLIDGRYERFLDEENSMRAAAGLVPYSRACLLRFAGPQASITASSATALLEHVRAQLQQAGWCAIGPAPAARAKVAGLSRWQLLLQGPTNSPLPLPAEAELRALLHRSVHLAIDPDPQEL
ncbi:MAG: primosomal protein N' [Synechococcus sp.]|nr:primosomal protein N' [Synechococcus sp.]